MSKQQLVKLHKELAMRKARTSYLSYLRYVHDGQYIDAEHHRYIAQVIQDALDQRERDIASGDKRNQYIMLSVPPRHGKSMTISETLPSYFIGCNPDCKVITASYGDDLAKRFGKLNMDKMQRYGMELFGLELDPSTRSMTDWAVKGKRGMMISRGILAGSTGHGADCLLIDDPIKTREDANSQTTRDKLWNEWKDTFSTRLHPNAIVVVIMTRWHEDDLCGRLLNPEYGEPLDWRVVNLPLECDEKHLESEGNPLNRRLGEALWPEWYGADFIEERKRYSSTFDSLYQGRPTSAEGNIFKREWWRFYEPGEITVHDMAHVVLSVDATFKDSAKADKVALQVWGKRGSNFYLIDLVNRRMDFTTTLQAIRNLLSKYPQINLKLVEDKANGSAIINVLNKEIGGFVPVNPLGGKESRAYAVTPYIEAGNVIIPRASDNTPWVHDFIEECSSFPKGAHDDMVDGMTQAISQMIFYYGHTQSTPPGSPTDGFFGKKEQHDTNSFVTQGAFDWGGF